jgi:predicted acyltransferase
MGIQDSVADGSIVKAKAPRLLSLDFFRGFTVAAMILVNNPGSWAHIYAPLEHSAWNGCTPTDLVFPFFLFIVGISIVYAMESRKSNPALHGTLLLSILRRAVTIIFLGMCLSLVWKFDLAHLRIPGVLFRIGVVFGISSLIYIKTNTKTQVYIAAALLLGYYILMNFVPVPGYGPANLEPETNLGAWLDRLVFTENHLWKSSKTWDPEGLLGTLPAIGTSLIGILTGTWLKKGKLKELKDLGTIAGTGFVLVVLALIWNLFFPINKSLWTSSFVLYTGGLGIIILSLSYWLIDIKKYQLIIWPFVAFGRNAITAFVLSGVLPRLLSFIPYTDQGVKTDIWSYVNHQVFEAHLSPNNASLISAFTVVLLIFLPIWWMYKKNVIVKV